MNKKAYDTDTFEIVTVNWFAVAGVILGAIVANVVTWGIASINGMIVAALCYVIGEMYKREKIKNCNYKRNEKTGLLTGFFYIISAVLLHPASLIFLQKVQALSAKMQDCRLLKMHP